MGKETPSDFRPQSEIAALDCDQGFMIDEAKLAICEAVIGPVAQRIEHWIPNLMVYVS